MLQRLRNRVRYWNATDEERAAHYPCDLFLAGPFESLVRAIDVSVPSEKVFPWLCQLKVAPYSFDWLDNIGRKSPRQLTPGVEQLEPGQTFLAFEIIDFEWGKQITGRGTTRAEKLFGSIAVTYCVRPVGEKASRLIVKLNVAVTGNSLLARLRRELLICGDFIMMRQQLKTLKERAENS